MCERCAELEEEVAFLKRTLRGEVQDAAQLRLAFHTTPIETAILNALYTRKGKVLSKDQLWVIMWPSGNESAQSEVNMRVCIHRLRKKLGSKDSILSSWGHGWALSPDGIKRIESVLHKKGEEPFDPSQVS